MKVLTRKKHTTQYLLFFLCTITILSWFGCNTFDRDEQIPSYLYIEEFELETKSNNSQGSNAHDILDAWVYVDGQLIGAFEVPAMVPVLAVDTARITVLAGVKKNGRSDNRVIYPFYKGVQDTLILVSGNIDTIKPIVKYHDSTQFKWIEDFEDRTISMEYDDGAGLDITEDSIRLTQDPALVYNYSSQNQVSGYVEFDSVGQRFENSTISKFSVPANTSAYFEINYKLDVPTQIGFYVYDNAGILIDRIPILYLFETDGEWKKSYISFNEDMSNPAYASATFKVFMYSFNNTDNPNARIYFDNLKLLHY